MTTTRIVLAEDHTLVRAGIRALLENLPGIEVVGEADNGQDAVRLIEAQRPDIALLDIAMRGLTGLEVAQRAIKQAPTLRVIVLSMYANEEYVWQALRNGVAGYLLKDAGISELEQAIKSVMRGETYLSTAVSNHVASYLRRVGEGNPVEHLTPRQREILQLIAKGLSTLQMAQQLNVSPKTVETHRSQLMDRLGIHDVAGLVRYAMRIGLIGPND